MPPRPDPLYHSVSNTFSLEDLSESERVFTSVPNEGGSTSSPNVHDTGGVTFRTRANDVCLLVGIFVILLWPWIFLAKLWDLGGIQMDGDVVKVIKAYPQTTNFLITLIGNIVSIITSIIFSTVVVRFAQEWTTNNDRVTVFNVSLISAFRHQNWPWAIKDYKYLLVRSRWMPAVLAGVCISAFALVPSGTTSLITPVSFNRTLDITGTELDFSSNAADCVDWFVASQVLSKDECNWQSFNGLRYMDCISPDHLVDFLDSGRSSILSLFSNNSERLILGELGANYPLRFLGPSRGVLPINISGIHTLGTPQPSLLSYAETNSAILSYNYTFDHQGLASNISCIYDTKSPIIASPAPNNTLLLEAYGSCNDTGLADVLLDAPLYVMPNTNYTLTFWACKSIPTAEQDPTYYIYLSAFGESYERQIGNISCTISPIQPAVFPVTYQSITRVFSTQKQITASAPANSFSNLIEYAINGLGAIIAFAQTPSNNLVAASVLDLGVQAFGFGPHEKPEEYLPMYEAMIEGILVDEFTYVKFLYSMVPDTPASCIRPVNGTMSTEVTGWVAKPVHIWFLMPMTILNLASLVIMLMAIARAKRNRHEFDPTDPRPLVLAEASLDESDPSGWADGVLYRSRDQRVVNEQSLRMSELKV